MLQKLRNKKGEAMMIIGLGLVTAVLLPGVIQKIKGKEGVRTFNQDGQIIWCKMQGKTNCGY
jgi:hypothetical protein